jgi:hypothetical protein
VTTTVVVSGDVEVQIGEIDRWWREHRPAAPGLLVEELAACFDLLASASYAGRPRLARQRGWRWRILRVRSALSERLQFDWLPNPFQEGFGKHFRLRQGGMMVSYAHQKARTG